MDVRHEEDGDLHVIVRLDSAYRRLLDSTNYSQQQGGLVVELMARDGGHLPAPTTGARLAVVGAWVLDTEHGWREIHPVFAEILDGQVYRSGPRFGGSPAGDYSSSAAEDCPPPRREAVRRLRWRLDRWRRRRRQRQRRRRRRQLHARLLALPRRPRRRRLRLRRRRW